MTILRRMTKSEITARRIELFNRGNMHLEQDRSKMLGVMVGDNPEGVAEAKEYNELAEIHGSAPE